MEQTESESLYYAVTCTITITFRSWGGTCNTQFSWDAGRLAEEKPACRWKSHSEVTKTLHFPRECALECAHSSQKISSICSISLLMWAWPHRQLESWVFSPTPVEAMDNSNIPAYFPYCLYLNVWPSEDSSLYKWFTILDRNRQKRNNQ